MFIGPLAAAGEVVMDKKWLRTESQTIIMDLFCLLAFWMFYFFILTLTIKLVPRKQFKQRPGPDFRGIH